MEGIPSITFLYETNSTNNINTTKNFINTIANGADFVEKKCFAKNEDYDNFRFALVVYIGTPIAFFGIISNAILIKVFASRERFKSLTLYLFALAIFDFLICALYAPFFTIDALAIYFNNALLYQFWHLYVMALYGTSRIVQFASTYMVVCATLERFIVVANVKSLLFISTTRGRYFMVFSTLILVLLLRIPSFFDYKIENNKQCPIFQDYSFVPLLMSREDYQMYNFYVLCFLHILLPFILLLILNLSIVGLTKQKIYRKFATPNVQSYLEMPQILMLLRSETLFANFHHRNELRFATRTMVMITFTYLFCNAFNVIITVMENVFKDNLLMFNEDGSSTKFYTYTADLISIMATVNSFARIFVYFFCNPQLRYQLICYAKQCLILFDKKKLKSQENNEKINNINEKLL